MVQTLFSLCLQNPGVLALAVCFDAMVENLITILVHIWADKIKATDDKQIFLEIKFYLSRDIKRFVLLDDIALFLLKPSIQFFLNVLFRAYSLIIKRITRITWNVRLREELGCTNQINWPVSIWWRPATLLKDSGTGVFLWILRNF